MATKNTMIAGPTTLAGSASSGRPFTPPAFRPGSKLMLLRQRLGAAPWDRQPVGEAPWDRQPIVVAPEAPPLAQQQPATPESFFTEERVQPQVELPSFLTEQERAMFSPSQLEFLERKRRAAAGLGPVMPESCNCRACAGTGSVPCMQCGGTGVNATDRAEEMFQNERNIVHQTNGRKDTRVFFLKDCPCWLCRGDAKIACPDCGGSGLHGLQDFVAD